MASSTATWRPSSPGSSAARRPDRFRLAGPSAHPDPRTHAYRKDIADVALAGTLFAPHYAEAVSCRIAATSVMLRSAPDWAARAVSQLVLGERFEVIDIAGSWAWGRAVHDSYVGYVPKAGLDQADEPATHRIVVPSAPVFGAGDIKAAVCGHWPIGARFAGEAAGDFIATADGFVHVRHAAPIDRTEPDPVAVATRMIGQPYLWGGRGAGGIDCSGLVQLALGLAGVPAPRDSDMQRDGLGRPLDDGEPAARGDLIFFPGHVGLMVNETSMIHATAHCMAVVIEPLGDVVARLAAEHARPILARRRLA